MKGFIVYPTYTNDGTNAYVHLFGRLENGESFLTINKFDPYFCIKKKDLKKAEKLDLEGMKFVSKDEGFRDFNDNEVVKIVVDIPSTVPKLRKIFEDNEIECYEADIRFPYRFMIDHGLLSSLDIEGDHEKGERVNRIYREAKIKRIETKDLDIKLKTLSFDIETDSKTGNLYSISLYSEGYSKVIFIGKHVKKLNHAIIVDDEKEALLKFNEYITEFDPDIITGWNIVDFDFSMLDNKYKKYKIPFAISRTNREATLRLESGFMMDSKADVQGRVVLDGIQLLKNSFFKLEDYKLGTAAKEYLDEKKVIDDEKGNKVEEIDRSYREDPQKLVDYNLKDSKLVYDILYSQGIIDLTMSRSLLTGMPLDRVQASVASLDSLYIRELRKHKYVAPSVKSNRKDEDVTGGFVMKSKPGIYNNVIVCDFKSLYPSIIRTFNIDPISFAKAKGSDVITTPNGARFSKEEGILPGVIENLWKARDKMKKENNKAGSFAIKIHLNSFYGVLANPSCRFYSNEIANAITMSGREIIQAAANLIREEGFDVIYGDTDSIFVNLNVDDVEKAKVFGKKIEKTINEHYDKMIKEKYGRKNCLEIQFEKLFTSFMMPYTRGTTEGAKKRYAGMLLGQDGKEKIDFTGLEFVRRDWTALSKKFQLELLSLIFKKKEVTEYIKNFVKELYKGKYDDLLVYKKSLRKGVDDYTKTTPPHVKAARILEAKGLLNSTIIEYMMTDKGPEPVQLMKGKIDYDHYVEKQLKPIADSVLAFYNTTFDELISSHSQSSLFDF